MANPIRIALQAGHVDKPGVNGAPNESATNKRITDRLSSVLRDRGFDVTQTNYYAWQDPNVTKVDFDLFLALHCDMDYPNDNGSGFADYPEPSTDGATNESQRICKVINDFYFQETGITYKNRSNANTRFYYMWQYLTSKTPCVVIEMGQSIDPHDSVLLANTDLIANALGRAICKAFNVAFDTIPPVVVPSTPPLEDSEEVKQLKIQIENLKQEVIQAKKDGATALATARKEYEDKIYNMKYKIVSYVNQL